MTPETFDALFDQFHSTAFRLEKLPAYAVGGAEAERVRAFREGLPRPERSVRTSPWLARIAVSTAGGKSWQRVRVVDDPLTDYQRYQLDSMVESQACGEEILLLDRAAVPRRADVQDFWLFDSGERGATAVYLHYTPDGAFGEFRPVEDREHLGVLHDVRWSLARRATPLNVFLAGRRAGA